MTPIKIQLCGALAIVVDGTRVEDRLPGRQGRLLAAYLTLNRLRAVTRDELVEALWPDGRDGGLAPLLSKLRRVLPIDGARLTLPGRSWVDVEAVADAVHRAESAIAQGAFARAWGPAQVALFAASRPLLPGEDTTWLGDERRRLAELRLRALEAYGAATLGVGGTELAAAVRAGRKLCAQEPYRESGWRILISALAAEGNVAEALREYERLRVLLREELGIAPSSPTQELHRALLG
ncbi:MAG TPA: BTAD domain-containing putative transcriptional regulator [Gaiellaceae bacterium]|nr:BTAD domain-containing putative transcriptional regulator [Gaiellaceae bacterium]